MIKLIILVVFYLTFPLAIIYVCRRWSFFRKLGTIVFAYGFGLFLGTSGIFPSGSDGYKLALQDNPALKKPELEALIEKGEAMQGDMLVNDIAGLQSNICKFAILLALPLLLFSVDLKRWLRYARKGYFSVALALVAGIIMVTTGFFIWKNSFPDTWKLAGMFEGIYTGGTPNFAALKLILNVDADRFIILNTYDIIVGAFLVLFFVTVAPRIFRSILPKFKEESSIQVDVEQIVKETEGVEDFSGMLNRESLFSLIKAFGLTVLIAAAGAGFSLLLPDEYKQQYEMAVVVLSITSLGILASLIKSVNRIPKTFQLGMYLILIFSLTVASMSDLRTIVRLASIDLILFITWVYFGSLIMHLILAKIFRIDSDNFLITATAFIFSPPFVPLVANALKNKDVIVTGITGGIIGYLLGNYFGYALAQFLKGFM